MPLDMSGAAKAPPRKRAASGSPGVRSAVAQPETRSLNEKRTDGLLGLGQLGQGLCLMFGLYADAAAIGQHFPPMAKELSNVADDSDVVAKPIDLIIQVGPYGALIATAMPLVMQLMANHKMVNAEMLMGQGVVPPELLEAQMKARVQQAQAQAMREQQMAMQDARNAQAEFEQMMTANGNDPTEKFATVS